jgi:hypothetical protein
MAACGRFLCSLLVATLPLSSVLADAPKSKNAKVTLVRCVSAAVAPARLRGADGGARGPKIMREHAECHRDDKNDHRQR